MGTPYTFEEGMSFHSTRLELFYFDDNFRRIAQWVRPLNQDNFGSSGSRKEGGVCSRLNLNNFRIITEGFLLDNIMVLAYKKVVKK